MMTTAKSLARIGLRLPANLVERVEAYAHTHHIDRALALRCLLEAGLAAEALAVLDGDRWGAQRAAAEPRRTDNVLALVTRSKSEAA